jgi:hypothetical protein
MSFDALSITSGHVLRAGTHYLSPTTRHMCLCVPLRRKGNANGQRDLPLIRKILEYVEANTSIQAPRKLEFEIFDGYDP